MKVEQLRFSPWLLILIVAAVSLTVLPGCGGDADDSGSKNSQVSSDDVDGAKADAESAKKDADAVEAAKFAKTEYEKATEDLAKATEYVDDGKNSSARGKYRTAKKMFERATKVANRAKQKHADAIAARDQYLKLKESALEKKVNELEPRIFAEAETQYNKGVTALEAGKSSKMHFTDALGALQDAVDRSLRTKTLRDQALAAKTGMEKAKQSALDTQAQNVAAYTMQNADREVATATAAFDEGRFQDAKFSFDDAAKDYALATDEAKRRLAEVTQPPRNVNSGIADAGNPGGQDSSQPAPAVGKIDVPDVGDGGTDVDLVTGIGKLFHGSPDYDSDGYLKLGYENDGESFKKDVAVLRGKVGENVVFVGDTHTGTKDYTIGGNTAGLVLIKAGFRDSVRIRAEFAFQLWAAEMRHYLEILVHSDGSGRNCHALQLGNRGIVALSYRDGNPVGRAVPSALSAQRTDVNRWLIKRDTHVLDIKVIEQDKKLVMEVDLDSTTIIKRRLKSRSDGYIGFRWSGAKWYATKIDIKGKIDEQWAKRAIAKGASDIDGQGDGEKDGDDKLDF